MHTVSRTETENIHNREAIGVSESFDFVLLQPTSFCNINCDYCYLPDRNGHDVMPLYVAQAVASSILEQNRNGIRNRVQIFWHGGEPLTTPKDHFKLLLESFDDLRKRDVIWSQHQYLF